MDLNTLKCNHLTPLGLKGLTAHQHIKAIYCHARVKSRTRCQSVWQGMRSATCLLIHNAITLFSFTSSLGFLSQQY